MPQKGHFILHSSVLPPVTAGRYEYVSKVTGTPFTTREERTHVQVTSPRYTMPTDQILSSFPPANAEGAFGDRLPQIVLKRRTLPWERNPAGGLAVSSTPWLALVVIAEGEGEVMTATKVADAVTSGVHLDAADKDVDQTACLAVTETVVRKVFPTKDDLPLLVHVREVDVNDTELANGDDDGWLAVVLANRLPVMDVAAGTPVRYMACLVNVEGQLHELPKPSKPTDHFGFVRVQDWRGFYAQELATDQLVTGPGFAVSTVNAVGDAPRSAGFTTSASRPVVGALDGAAADRLSPKTEQWSLAVEAVSKAALEREAPSLVRDAMSRGWHVPISEIAIERVLKFPVLAYWSFTTTEGATFESLMQDLDFGLLGTLKGEHLPRPPDPEEPEPTIGAPTPPPVPLTTTVLETGHIELGHRTRRGDAVRAWYRGPLVPHPTKREERVDGALPLAHSSDQLRRNVPDGNDDLGYAAAFEIGRLLALSQLSIVSALLRFRAEQFGKERTRQIANSIVPFEGLLTMTDVSLSRFVSHSLVEALAVEPKRTMGPTRPVVDPGRAIRVPGDLDRVIATGLGLDLDVLRKTSSKIGMEAALAATPVPSAPRGRETDAVTRQVMEQSLDAKIASAVRIAVPELQFRPGDAPATARRAARPRDALDELIAAAPEYADPDPLEP
jgi:hypothetical protein